MQEEIDAETDALRKDLVSEGAGEQKLQPPPSPLTNPASTAPASLLPSHRVRLALVASIPQGQRSASAK